MAGKFEAYEDKMPFGSMQQSKSRYYGVTTHVRRPRRSAMSGYFSRGADRWLRGQEFGESDELVAAGA